MRPRIPEAAIKAAFPNLKLSFVGRGGQSDAWRGEDAGRAEILRVLVKVEPGRVANEVAALRKLVNPHLMRFYGLGEVDHGGRKFPVIRGEYIDGGTVQDAIQANAWPSLAETLDCARGVADALVALHAYDIVHRDIKPANVALRNGDWDDAVVLDLGYLRNLVGPPLTVYPTHIGTIAFMAPEQLRLEPAGLRSDVYALAITIFFLLGAQAPVRRRQRPVEPGHQRRADAHGRCELARLGSTPGGDTGYPPRPATRDAFVRAERAAEREADAEVPAGGNTVSANATVPRVWLHQGFQNRDALQPVADAARLAGRDTPGLLFSYDSAHAFAPSLAPRTSQLMSAQSR